VSLRVRRLAPGDEAILELLAREDADFDLAERGEPLAPLSPEAARDYLADPHVLHWIAEQGGVILGHLYCAVVRKRAADPLEVLLYEIGVRAAHRRRGVGRALMAVLDEWIAEHQIIESWVLADNADAVAFYRACGFVDGEPPVYLVRPDPAEE